MNRVVILGGSGFVGRNLVHKLNNKFDVRIMIHNDCTEEINKKFKDNILSPKNLDKELQPNDIVINLIGQYHNDKSSFVDLNITGGLNLLNSCLRKKVSKIILASSINVYGENNSLSSKEDDPLCPQTFYGTVKFATEKLYEFYSKAYGINVMILRLSNLYGPNKKNGIIFNLLNAMKGKKTIISSNGSQSRDFLFIDDAISGIVSAIENFQQGYSVFNISSGKKYLVKDVIDMVERISNKKLTIEMSNLSLDEQCVYADNSKSKTVLKFEPRITMEEGLKVAIDHFMKS